MALLGVYVSCCILGRRHVWVKCSCSLYGPAAHTAAWQGCYRDQSMHTTLGERRETKAQGEGGRWLKEGNQGSRGGWPLIAITNGYKIKLATINLWSSYIDFKKLSTPLPEERCTYLYLSRAKHVVIKGRICKVRLDEDLTVQTSSRVCTEYD
jgi:hypothetical protein